MAPKLQKGDRVILEIQNKEVYEGTIENISSQTLELFNIFCPHTDINYDGTMTFYRNELISLAPITTGSSKPIENGTEEVKKIAMHPDEFDRLKQMTFNYIFVDTFRKEFDDAVTVLSNRESVSVVGLGNTFVRGKGLSLLVLSDFKQIYIFDLLCLMDLRGLKDILESDFICKVLYDGTSLYDCLYHKYKVEMRNVIDIKTLDSMSSPSPQKIDRNISQCLSHHFNFPSSLLSAAIEDMADKNWIDRPITKGAKFKAAQLVVYLLSLRDKLMAKILSKYRIAIENDYTPYKTMADAELLKFKIQN